MRVMVGEACLRGRFKLKIMVAGLQENDTTHMIISLGSNATATAVAVLHSRTASRCHSLSVTLPVFPGWSVALHHPAHDH